MLQVWEGLHREWWTVSHLGEHLVSCGREKAESEKRQSSSQEEGQHRTGFQAKPKAVLGQKVGDKALGLGWSWDPGDTPWKRWAFPWQTGDGEGREACHRGQERRHTWGGRAGSGIMGRKPWKVVWVTWQMLHQESVFYGELWKVFTWGNDITRATF